MSIYDIDYFEFTDYIRESCYDEGNNVYVIRAKNSKLFKVGISHNVDMRLKQIKCQCPFELFIYCVIKDVGKQAETIIHNLLSDYRQRGEWFNSKYALDEMREICLTFGSVYDIQGIFNTAFERQFNIQTKMERKFYEQKSV